MGGLGCSFKQVLDLTRKSRLNWGMGGHSIVGALSREYGIYIRMCPRTGMGHSSSSMSRVKLYHCMLCPDIGFKCPVHLLDLYISKLPSKATENDTFYVRPLGEVPSDQSAPSIPVGKYTLND